MMNAQAKSPSTGKTVAQLNEELNALALQIPKKKGDDRKTLLADIDAKQKEIDDIVKNRELALAEVQSSIAMYEFSLSELGEATRTILGAVASSGSTRKASVAEQPAKDPLIVGKFKLADYGFTMPTNVKGEPASTDTEFEWDYNKRYGGRAWQNAFITTLKKAGVDKISKSFTDDFKKWLETTKTSTHGRYATKPVFGNKKEFYADFGTEIDILTGKPEAKK